MKTSNNLDDPPCPWQETVEYVSASSVESHGLMPTALWSMTPNFVLLVNFYTKLIFMRFGCVCGSLLLLPFRNNKVTTPSWMPILEINSLRLLLVHLLWLRDNSPKDIVPRVKRFVNRTHVFTPSMSGVRLMSPDTRARHTTLVAQRHHSPILRGHTP